MPTGLRRWSGVIDHRRGMFGRRTVTVRSGTVDLKIDPLSYAMRLERMGVGEIFMNSVDRDGTMRGYDIELIREVSAAVRIPVVACGGAGTLAHLSEGIRLGGASAVAAGSMFVFHGRLKAVLISYPSDEEMEGMGQEGEGKAPCGAQGRTNVNPAMIPRRSEGSGVSSLLAVRHGHVGSGHNV